MPTSARGRFLRIAPTSNGNESEGNEVFHMKAVGILIVIALAVMVYIFLRFVIKRIGLLISVKTFAKKHGFGCKCPLSCLLPSNCIGTVEIESANTVYTVKLFGLLRKHCEIHFWNFREYSVEWYFSRYGLVNIPHIGQTNANRRRSLGNADWAAVTGEKEVVPILLISPANAPVRLTQTRINHLEDLRAGEKIGDVIFADMDYLFRFIAKREKTQ